jgi:D-alanyl-D-alanine carboxypeptidase
VIESVGNPLPIYSITKTFIGAAILALKINLDSPVSTWFEQSLLPRAAEITVKHLLSHTSGLRDYGANPAYIQAVNSRGPVWTDDEFAMQTLRQPLLFEPGCGWSYANPGFWLLSQIAQRESGLDFDGVIRRTILEPLGLSKTFVARGIFPKELPEYPAGWVWHGLLISTAADVARFMTSDLVTPLNKQLMKVPGEHPHWSAPHYGYGLMVEPGIRYGHEGEGLKFTAACYRFLPEGLTGCVIMESNHTGAAFEHLLKLLVARQSVRS